MNTILLPGVEAYVTRFFTEHPRPELTYHTLSHTKAVVKAAEKLAHHYQLSEPDHLTVVTAAWFHDLGYLTGPPDGHEATGADLARAFLQQSAMPAPVVEQVAGCIRATKMPQSPGTLLEEILCDADLFHLASDEYKDGQKKLRKEKKNLTGVAISGFDWRQENIAFLSQHRYFTDYARTLLQKGLAGNLRKLHEKQAEKTSDVAADLPTDAPASVTDPAPNPAPASSPIDEVVLTKGKKKGGDNRPDRGIETMFRTTSTNHLRLSEIADSKANIMISVNSIMVSVIVSVMARRIEENHALILPTGLFLTTSVLTIIFSILATRPNVTEGTFSREDIEQKRGNLLFFGNFHQMSLSDFEWGISELMKDSGYLYGTMTRDIYYLGQVLGKKYKRLRLAYNTFMVGFVVSVISFVIVALFFSK